MSLKKFTNKLNIDLTRRDWVEKKCKENVLGTAFNKEGHVDSLLGHDLSLFISLKKVQV